MRKSGYLTINEQLDIFMGRNKGGNTASVTSQAQAR